MTAKTIKKHKINWYKTKLNYLDHSWGYRLVHEDEIENGIHRFDSMGDAVRCAFDELVWSSPKKVDTFLRTTHRSYVIFTHSSREKTTAHPGCWMARPPHPAPAPSG